MKKNLCSMFILFVLIVPSMQIQSISTVEFQHQPNHNEEKMLGIDANYVLDMHNFPFRTWRYQFHRIEPYSFFSSLGANYFRLRLFAKENGSFGLQYATETAKLVQQQGLQPYLVIFLSDDWADFGKQPVPESWISDYDWFNLTLEQQGRIVYNYTSQTVSYFLQNGIDIDLYEIGNEIDFGLCGYFEEDYTLRENISYMKQTTWETMAHLIKAAIDGVKSVDPTSQFLLHITHWWDDTFSEAFFNHMIESDVQFDYMGLSFYPSSGIYNLTETLNGKGNGTKSHLLFQNTVQELFASINKQIIICEYAYPSLENIIGPFSWFNHEVDGYPLTKEGQKKWVADFLQWCYFQPSIAGMFYWSPEYFSFIWAPLSFFSYMGFSKPVIDAFKQY